MSESADSALVCPKCKSGKKVVFLKAYQYHFCTDCSMIVGFEVPKEGQLAPSTT